MDNLLTKEDYDDMKLLLKPFLFDKKYREKYELEFSVINMIFLDKSISEISLNLSISEKDVLSIFRFVILQAKEKLTSDIIKYNKSI